MRMQGQVGPGCHGRAALQRTSLPSVLLKHCSLRQSPEAMALCVYIYDFVHMTA